MNTFGTLSYGVAAAGFALLSMLLAVGSVGRSTGLRLILASVATTLWAVAHALQSWRGLLSDGVLVGLELLRNGAWLFVLIGMIADRSGRWLLGTVHFLVLAIVTVAFAAMLVDPSGSVIRRFAVLTLVAAGALLVHVYRTADAPTRATLHYFVVALASVFMYDLSLHLYRETTHGLVAGAWSNARGLIHAAAVPLIVLTVRRYPAWSVDVFVSRHIVFYAAAALLILGYLVVLTLTGSLLQQWDGALKHVAQIVFIAGALVLLGILVASNSVRRHLQVFISKHFYRNKYDYRIEWLRFIATLSSTEERDVLRTSIRALTEIVASPGGILFMLDDQERRYVPSAAWPIRVDAVHGLEAVPAESEIVRLLRDRTWIIDLQEYRRSPELYEHIPLPDWLRTTPNLRIVAPLLKLERLSGFFVLYDPSGPFELTYEDRDLLKTVGRHVATHIAQHDADRKLAESRQFEAYNRFTAFMMHDLKNAVAQLQMVVSNSARHRGNPEFIDDAIETIANAVERINRLIEHLRGAEVVAKARAVSIEDVTRIATARCSIRPPAPRRAGPASTAVVSADPDRLSAVIEHMIRNAQDATAHGGEVEISIRSGVYDVTVSVCDTGQGMEPQFIRERLFRPFDSTKGSKGMGIGAYQIREYVRMLGGHVEVQSSPGSGTTFSITLPVDGVTLQSAVEARH